MASPSTKPAWLLFSGFLSGFVAVGLAWLGLGSIEGWVERLTEAVGVLVFSLPDGVDDASEAIVGARLAALLGGALTGLGAVLELFPSVRDGYKRIKFWILRSWPLRRRPAVVIGLGWVGGPLAAELRQAGRPVVGVALDESSPRVAEARRAGVLVVLGDASDDITRNRFGLGSAREVFIATGDDARNVEIAGDLLGDAEAGRFGLATDPPRLRAYVHVNDPGLRATISRECLFETTGSSPLHVEAFGAAEMAARHVLLDAEIGIARRPEVVPSGAEVPHLLVFGFGVLGQTLVLDAARTLHFRGEWRPRITVFGERRADWDRFLAHCPGLTPPDLCLADASFLDHPAPDAWATRAGRPGDNHLRHHETAFVAWDGRAGKNKLVGPTAGGRAVQPVEYAAHVEFVELPEGDVAAVTVQAILERLTPDLGPPVRATAAFCFEEEQRAVDAALRVRRALFDRTPELACDGITPTLPVYVHLPTEVGLEELLDGGSRSADWWTDERVELAVRFPLRPFGRQRDVMSVADVTREAIRAGAQTISASHRQLRGGAAPHSDFGASNDAAIRFVPVRLDALGAREMNWRLSPAEAAARGLREEPVLWELMSPEVLRHPEYAQLEGLAARRGGTKIWATDLPAACFESGGAPMDAFEDDVIRRIYERLALLDRFHLPTRPLLPEGVMETPRDVICRRRVDRMVAARDAWLEAALARFEAEIEGGGGTSAVATAMEHNRWMAERLLGGWRFGERDDARRQRLTLVPTADLTDGELAYDRIHLPRLILERGAQWRPRHADPDLASPPPFYVYLSTPKK